MDFICLILFMYFAVSFRCTADFLSPLEPIDIPENIVAAQVYTKEKIAKYDGSNTKLPLLMAVRGVVFDVSSGKGFYGKGKSYNALAGKDATRAVAKMSLDPTDLHPDISDLTEEHLKSLQQVYTSVYVAKYPIVGYMDYVLKNYRKQKTPEDL